jgi:crossover junction endodeoxyribonuclease RusA
MTKLFDFVLPWPPSVNRMWRNTPAGTLLSSIGRAYFKRAFSALPHTRTDPHAGRLAVTLYLYGPAANDTYDIDNRVKAVFDACTHGKVWLDDSQVDELHLYRSPSPKDARVRVLITEL